MMTNEHAPPQSDRYQLVQARFDIHGLGPVNEWITTKRAENMSWAHISMAVRELVGMDVSYETLRRWSAREQQTGTPDADTD